MDEVAWNMAKDEYISSLEKDEEVMSFDNGSTYYWAYDIENLLEEKLELGSFFFVSSFWGTDQ